MITGPGAVTPIGLDVKRSGGTGRGLGTVSRGPPGMVFTVAGLHVAIESVPMEQIRYPGSPA